MHQPPKWSIFILSVSTEVLNKGYFFSVRILKVSKNTEAMFFQYKDDYSLKVGPANRNLLRYLD